ncbi:MAG: hypothetical protein HY518_01910 [Candidatus Aenigmarchaeota archaeon]|nr:hypothetical protein [Candidatus Aenigmarchaeota archaeon]
MEEVLNLLKELGMQEYETKAYLALLRTGISTAEQVSTQADIPLTRVYETLVSLQRKGLIAVINIRPKKYKLLPLKALENIVEEKKERMMSEIARAEAVLKKITSMAPKPNGKANLQQEQEDIWIIKGRKNGVRVIRDADRNAQREILIFADDISWFPEFSRLVAGRVKEGVNVKILCNVNAKTRKMVDAALSIGAEVRGWDVKGLQGNILDGKTAHIVCKIPKAGIKEEEYYGEPGNDKLFTYETITLQNPVLIKVFRTHFDSFWDAGNVQKERQVL